jgi:16S rRNA (guanine527-N7)-methyltransferase
MTEADARAWLCERFGVPRETQLARFAEILTAESQRQNLIARSTLDSLWARHIVDSAQLVPLSEGAPDGAWIDIGSGAGLPGIVAAILTDRRVILVEPRTKRVAFLRDTIMALGLDARVAVEAGKIESYRPRHAAAIISARAVAALPELLSAASHCADFSTVWVLPKGQAAQSEVDAARANWQGSFHVEPSITHPDSGIVVATQIGAR